jgi:hypothetical protein
MEFYLMPSEGGDTATTREAVLALFEKHSLRVERTETESSAGGPTFWRVFLADGESRLDFQESEGRLTFATLEHYMASDQNLVEATCLVLEGAGWEVDQENVG